MSPSGKLRGLAFVTVVLARARLRAASTGGEDTPGTARARPLPPHPHPCASSPWVTSPALPVRAMTRWKCRHAATAALARRLRPDLVLPLGDTQYEKGTLRQYRGSYARNWGLLLSRTRPTIGNHEYKTPGARGYFTYFQGRQPGRPGYYRIASRGWAIYHLNSNCAKVSCPAQAAWLRRQMTASPHGMQHHHRAPPEVLARATTATTRRSSRCGRPPTGTTTTSCCPATTTSTSGSGRWTGRVGCCPRAGMQSFVVGTGGKSLYGFGTRKRGSVYRHNRAFGVLVLYLKPRLLAMVLPHDRRSGARPWGTPLPVTGSPDTRHRRRYGTVMLSVPLHEQDSAYGGHRR